MSDKIFLVTAGCYSDFSIYGAFSTKENAQAYIDKRIADGNGFGDAANIEEWGIDAGLKEKKHLRYFVGMFLDDGAVIEGPHTQESFGIPANSIDGITAVPFHKNRPLVRVISIKSAEHAMKLAVEARQKWLRGDLKCR